MTSGYDAGATRPGSRRKARAERLALIPGAHEGYVSWERAEAIRKMVSDNVPAGQHHGAPKRGDALLAGLMRCRRCGRQLTVRYTGTKHDIPRYSCWRGLLDHREPRCIAFGGLRVDDAVEDALLRVARIVFEEYNATATLATGATETLVPAGDGVAFPLGRLDIFLTHGAPANLIETVNTVGLQIYARQIARPDGSAIEVKTEASILPINKRPRLAVHIFSSN